MESNCEDELTKLSINSEKKKQKSNLNGIADLNNMFDKSSINCTVFSMLGDATVVEGVSITVNLHEVIKIDNFSSMNKLLLVTSYVMRIINYLLYRIKRGNKQAIGYKSTEEVMHAELMWVRAEQLLPKKA